MATEDSHAPDNHGIVYVATNPLMPGIVKIGGTSRDDVQERLFELYSTGVPAPIIIEIARRVNNYEEVESALHTAFEPSRATPDREFFEVAVEQVAAALGLAGGEDVTPPRNYEPAGHEGIIEKFTPHMAEVRYPGTGESKWHFQGTLRRLPA